MASARSNTNESLRRNSSTSVLELLLNEAASSQRFAGIRPCRQYIYPHHLPPFFPQTLLPLDLGPAVENPISYKDLLIDRFSEIPETGKCTMLVSKGTLSDYIIENYIKLNAENTPAACPMEPIKTAGFLMGHFKISPPANEPLSAKSNSVHPTQLPFVNRF